MGSYNFKWEHPAEEVYVTGTFDNWTKSEKLEKEGNVFQKTVQLKDASSKIYYKFVVDGTWVVNDSAPKEPDHEGNVNNFLIPEDIRKSEPPIELLNTVTPTSTTAAMAGEQPIRALPHEEKAEDIALLNTVTPTSTTAGLAGQQPIEPRHTQEKSVDAPSDELPKETPSTADIPGGFPITPANELDKFIGVKPLPAAEGAVNPVDLAPGEKIPETVSTQNTHSNVKLDKDSYEKSDALPGLEGETTFGVNPLPAAEGGLNPITLAPGEKIPETISAQNTHSHVKLDKESYEKSDALPGLEADLPPVSKNTIPESSLPISGFHDNTLSSVGPTSTTAALAGQVPLESHIPEVVRDSQQKAHVGPDASANPLEVQEKAQVEEELKEKVPEVPPTSEGTSGLGTDKSENDSSANLAALAATAGGAVIAAGIAIKDTVQEKAIPAVTSAAGTVQETTAPYVKSATETVQDTAAPYITSAAETAHHDLPEGVKQSLPVSTQDAIAERAAQAQEERIEEISPEVPAEVNASIVAARADPEAAANTEAVEEKRLVEDELLKNVKPVAAGTETKDSGLAPAVPAGVKDSFAKSGESPEAAAHTQAVEEKKIVERELLEETKPVPANVEAKDESLAPTVPPTVQDSILESGKNPEAAGNTEAVQEKSVVEQELLREVKPVPAVGETTEGVKSHSEKPLESSTTEKAAGKAPVTSFSAYDAVTSQESEPVTTQDTERGPLSTQHTTLTTQQTEPALAEPVESKAKEPVKSDEPVEPQVAIPKTEELGAKVPQRDVLQTEEPKAKEPEVKQPEIKEPVTEQPKSDAPATSVPKTENKTITPVTNIENGSSATDSKPTETKPSETKTADAPANGGSREQKKKHNRLSSIFSKIKHKFSDK